MGHYEIQEILGRGGFGVVFKAFDDNLHRVVAVKVLGPRLVASAPPASASSARPAAPPPSATNMSWTFTSSRSSPSRIWSWNTWRGGPCSRSSTGASRSTSARCYGSAQTAEGLAAAHRQGLIHRDIKPSNILLENGVERVKITDFGLARAADDASITQSGVVAGTPLYMAPEQAQGETIDHRADLFSLGSVLYAMCTGQPPFRASSTFAVLKRVCEEAPRPIREINPDVPEWLCAVVARLHAKKPDDRFASARDVADALTGRLSELQMHSGGAGRRRRGVRRLHRTFPIGLSANGYGRRRPFC